MRWSVGPAQAVIQVERKNKKRGKRRGPGGPGLHGRRGHAVHDRIGRTSLWPSSSSSHAGSRATERKRTERQGPYRRRPRRRGMGDGDVGAGLRYVDSVHACVQERVRRCFSSKTAPPGGVCTQQLSACSLAMLSGEPG
jgi:hypothetical protein